MNEQNQEPRIVEITHTVKASEAAGRRLMKNIDTGEVFWEGDPQVQTGPVVVTKGVPKTPKTPKTPKAPKAKKGAA